ncbi:MAG: hypothetical protein KW802_01530 [Candidatus Doudnabacteria bacterium]|nr:hypothetical protein [Candidatus Doudnabacteria bacterium]
MTDQEVQDLIGWWIVRTRNLKNKGFHDEFVRFFIYYMCLDAWITHESGEDADQKKIKWFLGNHNLLKDVFIDVDRSSLGALKTLSPIKDMRPNKGGKLTSLSNVNDIGQVIRFIYQIRCNLFHGGKSPANGKDSDLVFHAGSFLDKWINWAHLKKVDSF